MNKYARGIYAGVYGFLTAIATAMVDGGFGDVTDGQWVFAVLAGMGAFGGIVGWNTVQEQKANA